MSLTLKLRSSILSCCLLLPASLLAEEAAPRFAAPGVAAAAPATGAGGIGQVTLALLLVLAAIFGIAWFMRRLRSLSGNGQALDVVAQVALGARERAVVVKVGDEQLLLGVAPGRVNLLHVLPPGTTLSPVAGEGASAGRPDFAALLKKSLGR